MRLDLYDLSITCGAGSAYPSGAHEITPSFGGVRVVYSLVFYVGSCVLLFVFFIFSHGVVSYFRFMSLTVPLVSFVPLLSNLYYEQ